MTDKKEAPEFYGGYQGKGEPQKVEHGAGRAARLKAAGVEEGKSLEEAWRERADQAFDANPLMQKPVVEPVTEKSIVGYSAEKKAALKLMESEGVSIGEAIQRVKSDATPKKSTRTKGKGE